MNLSSTEKEILLTAARESIKSLFEKAALPKIDINSYPNLKLNAGAFVTLKINEELRGCIGYITAEEPLINTVTEVAKHAAVEDPRFPSLSRDELDQVSIEISVLSPLMKIKDYSEIKIGEHGLLVEEGLRRGLLLPQVATENNFNVDQFLKSICLKAGLPPDFWKTKMLNLKVFTAQVFSEERSKNE